jgi:hypothetical protein
MYSGHEVLMEVDDNILLLVSDPRGILDQQLRPRSIQLLNITVIIIINSYAIFNNWIGGGLRCWSKIPVDHRRTAKYCHQLPPRLHGQNT